MPTHSVRDVFTLRVKEERIGNLLLLLLLVWKLGYDVYVLHVKLGLSLGRNAGAAGGGISRPAPRASFNVERVSCLWEGQS